MSEENQNIEENNAPQTPQDNGRFVSRGNERLEVPENFWDKENNAPDVFGLLKSQQDLRTQIGEDKSPKDGVYQINIPQEYAGKLEADPNDPLYKEFCKLAKAKRMSQEEFDSLSNIYYRTIASAAPDFDGEEYMTTEANKAKEKFGDDLDKVKRRIENFVNNSGISDRDILNELAFMQTSAAGVATLDYLLSLRGEPMPSGDGTGGVNTLSLDELRALQAKPEYKTDPALQAKVRKGYEDLYKTY